MNLKLQLLLLVAAHVAYNAECFSFNTVRKMFANVKLIYNQMKKIRRYQAKIGSRDEIIESLATATENSHLVLSSVVYQIRRISKHVKSIKNRLEDKLLVVENLVKDLPDMLTVNNLKGDVAHDFEIIDDSYKLYTLLSNKTKAFNQITMINFAKSVVTLRKSGLQAILHKIHSNILPVKSVRYPQKKLLHLLDEQMKKDQLKLCGKGRSPQLFFYELYINLITMECISIAMISFAAQIFHNTTREDKFYTLQKFGREMKIRVSEYSNAFINVMEDSDRTFRVCDPDSHVYDSTYYEMRGLYQAIVVEKYFVLDSCNTECLDINVDCSTSDKCISATGYPRECSGQLYNCSSISEMISICPFAPRAPVMKRYMWYRNDQNGEIYGSREECPGNVDSLDTSNSLRVTTCDFCVCTCEDNAIPSPIIKIISLLPARSDVENNMVITGIRFLKKQDIIYIQVKQGKLNADGLVESLGEEGWVPIPDRDTVQVMHQAHGNHPNIVTDSFVIVSRYHNAINMDDVLLPEGYVLTGVKFGPSRKLHEKEDGTEPLELYIEGVNFDYSTGKLIASEKINFMTSTTIHNVKIEIHKKKNPIYAVEPNNLKSSPNHYIRFDISNLKEDAGQTTLPLLDAQPVMGLPEVPLSGVGIAHKSFEGNGGFLTFKLINFDYTNHVRRIAEIISDIRDY